MGSKKAEADKLSTNTWIDLDEADYVAVGLRPRVPKPVPPAKPFDVDATIATIREINGYVSFEGLKLPVAMGRIEANFWLAAMTAEHYWSTFILDVLTAMSPFETDVPDLPSKLGAHQMMTPPEAAIPLNARYGFVGTLKWTTQLSSASCRYRVLQGMRRYILPTTTLDEYAPARAVVSEWLLKDPLNEAMTPSHDVMLLAADLDMRDEVVPRVANMQKVFGGYTNDRRDILLRTHDVEPLLAGLVRRDSILDTGALVRQYLAATGVRCVDLLVGITIRESSKPRAEAFAKALTRVHAPEMAPGMLDLLNAGVAPHVARAWFSANPARAAMGLAPLLDTPGSTGPSARGVLEDLCAQGYADVVRKYAGPGFGANAAAVPGAPATRSDSEAAQALPPDLAAAMPKSVKAHPTDPRIAIMPVIRIDGADGEMLLEGPALNGLFEALRKSTFEQPHAYVTAVRRLADPRSLGSFATALLESWVVDKTPLSARWRLVGAGLLGDNATVLKLGTYILEWPGQSGHARAVFGLQSLLAIGTDDAFAQLSLIAKKCTYEGLKTKAVETMDALAEARGLTLNQLEDRVIPRCGLAAGGVRVFDFGSRKFRFVLSGELKPMIKAEDGSVTTDFPKPLKGDDPELVANAKSDWAVLKKQVSQITKTQAERMDRAMIRCRRWTPAEFQELTLDHPILALLARRIIWGAYDPATSTSSPISTFRVTEDLTLADNGDQPWALSGDIAVGIVHPVALTEADRNAWGEILSDYEIIPPFKQLSRDMYTLTPEERESRDLKRLPGVALDSQAGTRILKNKHWILGDFHPRKVFVAFNATAVLDLKEGSWGQMGPILSIENCRIFRGEHPTKAPTEADRLPWGAVDPVVPSEVLRDLNGVTEKG